MGGTGGIGGGCKFFNRSLLAPQSRLTFLARGGVSRSGKSFPFQEDFYERELRYSLIKFRISNNALVVFRTLVWAFDVLQASGN